MHFKLENVENEKEEKHFRRQVAWKGKLHETVDLFQNESSKLCLISLRSGKLSFALKPEVHPKFF